MKMEGQTDRPKICPHEANNHLSQFCPLS